MEYLIMNKNKWCAALLSALMLAASSCTFIPEEEVPTAGHEVVAKVAVEVADPKGAVEAIYANLEDYEADALDAAALEALVGVDSGDITEFHVYQSDAKSGLSDVIIIKPISYSRDEVRECLYKDKEQRIREFEDYDILNAYSIAQNAIIYDQGDYVILLMMQDNETAKATIDAFIPQ
jgi:hypothetical protein